MIAKNKKGKSFGGCVRYVLNEDCEILEAEGVMAHDQACIIRDFAIQRSGRPEIKQPVGHIPISFSAEDTPRLTNDFMVQLAKEHMQEMGIGNTQYIVVRHNDTAHPHLHIVYNRIDNDLKVISVNNDYKRNIKACKKLKDRYGLTYGKTGKEKVNRPKLQGKDKVQYEIHDNIKAVLPRCHSFDELQKRLKQGGITIHYKYRSGAKESEENIQGLSFRKDGYSFKGSEIDKKFSYGNLKKVLDENMKKLLKEIIGQDLGQRQTTITSPEIKPEKPIKPSIQPAKTPTQEPQKHHIVSPPVKRNPSIRGVELTDEQLKILKEGSFIYLKNMDDKNGNKFSSFVFTDLDFKKVFFSNERPDNFIKHGKYDMRLMDKHRIEAGYLTKATVKWYGYGNYAHPYLWKSDKSDTEYRESWGDPRKPKQDKSEEKKQVEQPVIKKSKGRSM